MRNRIYNFYVCSTHFDGEGRGFAIGFDDERAAFFFARYCLFGFASVLTDWQLEERFPRYFHEHVS